MRRFRKNVAVFLVSIIIISVAAPVFAAAVSIGDYELSSQGAIVMDVGTGEVLFEHNADVRRVPASMMKLLAIYVVYDALKSGKAKLSDAIVINTAISDFSYDRTWSNVPLPVGMSVTIGELMEVVLVRSACAATVAMAEAVFGSEAAIISKMQSKATALGIKATIKDCWGGSPDNSISPRGFAVMTRGLLLDYPQILEITSKKSVTFKGVSYNTSNLLLGEYQGLDGLKTGFTNPAGYCFTGTAIRDGHRLIAITMGSSLSSRYPDVRAMLNYGFSLYEKAQISTANLVIDGVSVPLTAYLINDYHYFKLRDVAFLLNNTEKQFAVDWNPDTRTAILTSGALYMPDDKVLLPVENYRPYANSDTTIMYDGEICSFEIYLIDDFNWFRLRDLAAMIDFSAEWIGETRTVIIDTTQGYIPG